MDFVKLMEVRNDTPGFAREIGIVVKEITDGYAKVDMKIDESHINPLGTVHGGAIFSLADTAGGAAATSKGNYVTTVSGDINYLNPAIGVKCLTAKTRELKAGKKILVYDVTILDETEKVIAEARMTYYNLNKKAIL